MNELKSIHYIMGLLLFGMITVGMFQFIAGGASKYGIIIVGNLSETFSGFNSSSDNSSSLVRITQNKTEGGEASSSSNNFLLIAGGAAYDTIKQLFTSLGLIDTIISNLAKQWGIPDWFTITISSMIIISLVFLVIYLILRFRE